MEKKTSIETLENKCHATYEPKNRINSLKIDERKREKKDTFRTK